MNLLKTVRIIAAAAIVLTLAISPQAGEMVPAKARAAGQVVTRTLLANPQTSPLGTPFLHITSAGVGHATHLGKYTITFDTLIHLEMINGVLTTVWIGTFAATAANGDLLTGTFINSHPFGDPNFTGTAEFTGGTGRFAGATGFETTVGVLYPQPDGMDLFEYTHDGWISSVGSNKRN